MNISNVFLVSLDTTRSDVLLSGRFPGVNEVRKKAITFPNCIAPAPLTPSSHASVMTGLLPARHGIRHLFREKLHPECETLASVLRDHGFHTSAVVSCPGLNHWYEISRGFAEYDDEIPLLSDGSDPLQTVDVKLRGQALKRADCVVQRSCKMLEAAGKTRRQFHFMHFFDAHWPYGPPTRPFDYLIGNDYEAELAFADWHLAKWFNYLRASKFLEDSLVVVFADHGEDLNGWYSNDKGGDALGHPEEMGHGCLLYDQTVMVPLLFWHPQLTNKEYEQQVRLIDIYPTILDLLGFDIPIGLDGVSLKASIVDGTPPGPLIGYSETMYPREQVDSTNGEFAWARNKKSVRIKNRYKVIFHIDSDKLEVYDLADDPLEKNNLLGHPKDPRTP